MLLSLRSVTLGRALFLSSLWLVWGVSARTAEQQRPFRVDDRFELEAIDGVVFAPDGVSLAYSIQRPKRSLPAVLQSSLVVEFIGNDVWLQDSPGRKPKNLTNGLADGSGSWLPKWSPDGQRLAFLSSKGGNVTLWVWERLTDKVRQLSRQGIDFKTGQIFRWVDNTHILCLVPEQGELAPPTSWYGETANRPSAAWAKSARGELTASPVDSLEFRYKKRRLLLLDVITGDNRLVAVTTASPTPASLWVAPDGRNVAFVGTKPAPYGYASILAMGYPQAVELSTVDGSPLPLEAPLPENIHTQTIKWSPDGSELAFFANGPGPINPIVLYGPAAAEVMSERVTSMENPAKLYRVNVRDGRVQQLDTGEIDLGELGAPNFEWAATGELVFRAPRRRFGFTSGPPASRGAAWGGLASTAVSFGTPMDDEWWLTGKDGKTRPLFSAQTKLPTALQPVNDGATFVGVLDGDVWAIDVRGMPKNLTEHFTPTVTTIEPMSEVRGKISHILVSGVETEAKSGGGPQKPRMRILESKWMLPLDGGKPVPCPKPAPNATTMQFHPLSKQIAYYADDRNGTYLWRSNSASSPELLVETNTFRRGIAKSDCRLIDYRSLNGESQQARLCLPIGYVEGRQYPLVVELYMGSNRVTNERAFGPNGPFGSTHDYFTAAGYAYLFPTMRKNIPGMEKDEGDSILMLTDGALPAADKAVALGIADPDRLFVTGGSMGGWSTLGIITQTTRFKAAMAEASFLNQMYGNGGAIYRTFTSRHTEAFAGSAGPSSLYKGSRPSDVPWWRDGDRLRRNDPMSYVDRVQTPLLLIHGDLDPVDMTASEDFFNALVSQRKRAQIVRYWGEGHGLTTPVNVRDMWQRTFAWFDEFGDISRDEEGHMIFEGDRVKSRRGKRPLTPADFSRFGPAASVTKTETASR
jgi:dipeptidyl aminopeptidase/acylaminoacyl peptidase